MSHGISNRKNSLPVDKNKTFRCDTHDDAIGVRGVSGTAVTAGC